MSETTGHLRSVPTPAAVEASIERARRSAAPVQTRVSVLEDGFEVKLLVERVGVGPLLTSFGRFEMYAYRLNDRWEKYSVLIMAEDFDNFRPIFDPLKPVVVRFDSGCETGQIFGDRTCECRDQLELGLEQIAENGQGVLVNIPHQDGRGMGLPFKLATLRLQEELGVDTVEASVLFEPVGTRDSRTYAGAVAVLKALGIENRAITLSTNNPKKAGVFSANGYALDRLPNIIAPTAHTAHHLSAKGQHLDHEGLGRIEPETVSLGFLERLDLSVQRNNSFFCCGLDPILRAMPHAVKGDRSDQTATQLFMKGVVDATLPFVGAYKIQKAFFDLIPGGHRALRGTIEYIRGNAPDVPIILDAKTGDIENTMAAYLELFFDDLDVDAILVNPYMGTDVFDAFVRYPKKAGLVLCRTSNAGAAVIQDAQLADGRAVWKMMYDTVTERWRAGERFLPVLSASPTPGYDQVAAGDPTMPIFLAGVGAQGGDLGIVRRLANGNRKILVNSSRAILYGSTEPANWQEAVGKRAAAFAQLVRTEAEASTTPVGKP